MSRNARLAIASLVVVFVGFGLPAYAEDVTGILVDQMCFAKDKANTGNAHAGMSETCAQDCAKKGSPVALVTKTGDVYQVMAMGDLAEPNNAKLVPHMSHTVTLTGTVTEAAEGRPKTVHATALKMVSR